MGAYATKTPVHAADLHGHGDRWPGFVDAALGHGAAAVHAFPLRTAAVTLGTLTLYRREPSPLPPDVLDDARVLADIAGVVLLDDTTTEITDHIAAGGDAVAVALGVLAAALRVGTDEAHSRLRATAYATGRTLADVARDTLARYVCPLEGP